MKEQQPKTQSGKAAAYIRVSTLDQGERYSLPSQLKGLTELAARRGKEIPPEWVFVDKHSGKMESRPAFDKLKQLVRTGEPDEVVIYDVSRFARKTLDSLWLAADFKRHGVGLGFVEVPYEDTPTGRLTFTQMSAIAEYMGEKIIEDSKRGRMQMLASGRLDHGSAPDGYCYLNKKHGSRFELDPVRAQVWADIFKWRGEEHLPVYKIAQRLRLAGIPNCTEYRRGRAAGVENPTGGDWLSRVILYGLDNPTYMGKHHRAGVTIDCPAIVSEELFRKCQEYKTSEACRRAHTGRPSTKYLLHAFLWCDSPDEHGVCGHRMYSNSGSGGRKVARPFYRCHRVLAANPHTRICRAPHVYQDQIEPVAWSEIWSLLKDPARIMRLGQAHIDSQEKPTGEEGKALDSERTARERKIGIIKREIEDELTGYEEGRAAIRQHKARISEIETQLAALTGATVGLPPRAQLEAWCAELTGGPEPQTFEERRPVLEALRDLRIWYHDRQMVIEGQIPVPVKSTTCGDKKCDKGVDPDQTFFQQTAPAALIPFRITRALA